MKHVGAFDGLRGVAIVAVVTSHVLPTRGGGGGWIGVDIFFVLSGYLITSILVEEWHSTGTISLKRFYVRRALRLYPALITLVVVGAFFASVLGNDGTVRGYLLTALVTMTYMTDMTVLIFHNPFGGLGHTWSLSVEEHFYLIWPLLLIHALKRGRDPRWFACFGIAISLVLLATTGRSLIGDVPSAYYNPQTQACAPLLGCLLSLSMTNRARKFSSPVRGSILSAIAAAGLLSLFVIAGFAPRIHYIFPELLAAVCLTAMLIAGILSSPNSFVARILRFSPITALGKVSYGWYLYHLPIFTVMDHFMTGSRALMYALAVPTSLLAAVASYRYVEQPFLRRKKLLAVRSPSDAVVATSSRKLDLSSVQSNVMGRLVPRREARDD